MYMFFKYADDNVKAAYNFKRSVTLFAIFYPVLHMCENFDVFANPLTDWKERRAPEH